MKKHSLWQIWVLLPTVLATTALGDKYDDFRRTDEGTRNEPVFQTGLLVGYRLDDQNKYTYVPSIGGHFYYFFHPMVALHAGIGHTSLTRLTPGISYHTVVADVGMRVNAGYASVFPFLETGLSFPYHWGVNRGYEYVDFQPGVRIGAGLSWRASQTLAFDLTVSQIVNHWRSEIVALAVPVVTEISPCPLGADCPPARHEPDGAFNPTLLEFVVRFGL